jgi:hypothetical protein
MRSEGINSIDVLIGRDQKVCFLLVYTHTGKAV